MTEEQSAQFQTFCELNERLEHAEKWRNVWYERALYWHGSMIAMRVQVRALQEQIKAIDDWLESVGLGRMDT